MMSLLQPLNFLQAKRTSSFFKQSLELRIGDSISFLLAGKNVSFVNSGFVDYLHLIYQNELEVEDTTETQKSASYLVLHLQIYKTGRLKINLSENGDDFTFLIVNLTFISIAIFQQHQNMSLGDWRYQGVIRNCNSKKDRHCKGQKKKTDIERAKRKKTDIARAK